MVACYFSFATNDMHLSGGSIDLNSSLFKLDQKILHTYAITRSQFCPLPVTIRAQQSREKIPPQTRIISSEKVCPFFAWTAATIAFLTGNTKLRNS
jgi:hypothetical protein